MQSLFRIDRNSVTAAGKKDNVVVLPCFEDMIAHNDTKLDETSVSEEENSHVPKSAEEKLRNELQKLNQEIEDAKLKAQQILSQANDEAEQLIMKAHKQGYEAGFAEASASLMQAHQSEKELFDTTIAALRDAKQTVFSEIEDSVLDLALFIAERIIGIELERTDEVYLNIIKNTLSELKNETDITIKVGKDAFEKFFIDPQNEFVLELKNSNVEIRQDLRLECGECVVETEYGTISSGIQTQLKRLGYALNSEMR